ncbi:hypothetical protein EDC44_1285 [Cricetibacter osteomyelitidis]|uniref:Uncharacterized protein n=1 Tax=Cricetibacter osteomyelitidis TaxID=1521931 RepID=A0A4R2TB89_9PAST|nr:hypothetical protein [Cricetibacter osteomyelitidis]TCP92052.1 hypothetical protein EDC44_1285 [Cricetibacter osteomyelitidis]
MYIKYNELELSELFSCSEGSIFDNSGDGNVFFLKELNDFSLRVNIYIYINEVSIFLKYKNKDVLYLNFKDICNIETKRSNLIFYSFNKKEKCNINFGDLFLISVEE